MTARAATYARYSSDQQRESSLEDQQRNCHARATREAWEVVRDFTDAAISGSTTERPGYRSMLAAAADGAFDVLLIDELSRLSRDQVESETVLRRLEFRGVRVIGVTDGYDSRQPGRKVLRTIKALQNEMDLDTLRERVHRGITGQALKHFHTGGKAYGYALVRVTDPTRRNAYGEPLQIGSRLTIDPVQAKVVQQIFRQFVEDGASTIAIARDLNAAGVPSPGSTWQRKTRRCTGWLGNAVRVILRNELYRGQVVWNANRIIRDPDTQRHVRRARPESEWIVRHDEALRVVSDDLWQRAQMRTRTAGNPDIRLKSGGKRLYLLSGLLRCGHCGRSFQLADDRAYACGSHVNGRCCENTWRLGRLDAQRDILGPVLKDLLDPQRVAAQAAKMERAYARRIEALAARADQAPAELADLDARIRRLRGRLTAGDPDMTADELQLAIERAEQKRQALLDALPQAKASARIISLLPKAAAAYRRTIESALVGGDHKAASRARVLLKDMIGVVTLTSRDNGLWASYRLNPAMLLKGAGTAGRGDRI
ncbi:MAG: hypothetical protein FJ191_08345 [Gammaproteobacteria bacterium]|nr:hypothetical protein [Gammaproteobacteria bacterium]